VNAVCLRKRQNFSFSPTGTRYNIPFLMNRPGVGNNILGEIYTVDEQMLVKLDELEDYPNFYDRQIHDILCGDSKVPCWVYLLKTFPEKLLSLPLLTEYKDTPEKAYQERCKREKDILAKDDMDYNLK
jgi:gamma-glutamylaminecyclotransferase